MKHLGALVVLLAMAGTTFGAVAVPEIDGNSAGTAVALLAGGLMVLRGRKK